MPAILSRRSILFINYISRNLDNTKILLYKLFVRYLVVKPACINAAVKFKKKGFAAPLSNEGESNCEVVWQTEKYYFSKKSQFRYLNNN